MVGPAQYVVCACTVCTRNQRPAHYLTWSPMPAYGWESVTATVPFSPRDGAQLLSFKGQLFLLGG